MRKGLLIELIDPVVTSASPASAGAPEALEYIPGAMLLGVAAARGYTSGLSVDETFALFHSGSVRFDDGLPLGTSSFPGLPNPLSLHYLKGADPFSENALVDFSASFEGEAAVDSARAGHEQLQGKAVSAGVKHVPVKAHSTLRTAIDRSTGRATESQLFGYQMLDAGQNFISEIEAEDQAAIDLIVGFLTGPEAVFLGRAKSAEFGQVRITTCDALCLPEAGLEADTAYIWCLSDLWACDVNGTPTLAPDASAFGSSGCIDWSKSFTRSQRFSPYNGAWNSRGVERSLLQRGSVLSINGSDLKTGIYRFGLGQELGYGRVLVSAEPPLEALKALSPQFFKPISQPPQEVGGDSILAHWLAQRQPPDLDTTSELKDLKDHYRAAERINGQKAGPGPSQWGSLAKILTDGQDITDFLGGKRGDTEREQWGAIFGAGRRQTFQAFIEDVKDNRGENFAALLAKDIRKWLLSKGWFDV